MCSQWINEILFCTGRTIDAIGKRQKSEKRNDNVNKTKIDFYDFKDVQCSPSHIQSQNMNLNSFKSKNEMLYGEMKSPTDIY